MQRGLNAVVGLIKKRKKEKKVKSKLCETFGFLTLGDRSKSFVHETIKSLYPLGLNFPKPSWEGEGEGEGAKFTAGVTLIPARPLFLFLTYHLISKIA